MKKYRLVRRTAVLAAIMVAATGASVAAGSSRQILDVRFAPRVVQQIEVGDFHFTPGQPAPVHTHDAPVYGYVSKGAIIYQVEGQKQRILKTGDAFYEPVGPRILRFDNASKTEEAIFTDFNLERAGDPFIVFPKPPTAKIDRRGFPTISVGGISLNGVKGFAHGLAGGQSLTVPASAAPVTGYVVAGAVQIAGARYLAGQTFGIATDASDRAIVNASATEPARLVSFTLSIAR